MHTVLERCVDRIIGFETQLSLYVSVFWGRIMAWFEYHGCQCVVVTGLICRDVLIADLQESLRRKMLATKQFLSSAFEAGADAAPVNMNDPTSCVRTTLSLILPTPRKDVIL